MCRLRCVLSVTFRVYDVDNDGFISNADLYHVLKAMVRDAPTLIRRAERSGAAPLRAMTRNLGLAHCRLARCPGDEHCSQMRSAGVWVMRRNDFRALVAFDARCDSGHRSDDAPVCFPWPPLSHAVFMSLHRLVRI